MENDAHGSSQTTLGMSKRRCSSPKHSRRQPYRSSLGQRLFLKQGVDVARTMEDAQNLYGVISDAVEISRRSSSARHE